MATTSVGATSVSSSVAEASKDFTLAAGEGAVDFLLVAMSMNAAMEVFGAPSFREDLFSASR